MRFAKFFIVIFLCLLMGNCIITYNGVLTIEIGYYEKHLETWNNLNILDYQLLVGEYEAWEMSGPIQEGSFESVVNVKNGMPISSDPPEWLESGEKSTVNDFFLFIKEIEKKLLDSYNGKDDCRLNVRYNREYHYPIKIRITSDIPGINSGTWEITLKLPDETEIEQEPESNEE